MADQDVEKKLTEVTEKIPEMIPEKIPENIPENIPEKITENSNEKSNLISVSVKTYRMFGREKPLHHVLGSGKPADVLLWRDKKLSAIVLGLATLIWVIFELLEYHLLTLVCHVLLLAFTILFFWSNVSMFINKSPLQFPEIVLPEDTVLGVASTLRVEINRSLAILQGIASGKELKKFLAVIAGIWFVSVVGGWFNLLTLLYISFVLLLTVPVLYEKFEDQVDPLAEKALVEFKKQYAVFDAKVLSQIPRGPLKEKKLA